MIREYPEGRSLTVKYDEVQIDVAIKINHRELGGREVELLETASGADVAEAPEPGRVVAVVVEHLDPGGDLAGGILPLAQADDVEIPVTIDIERVETDGEAPLLSSLDLDISHGEATLAIVDHEAERAVSGRDEVEIGISIKIGQAAETPGQGQSSTQAVIPVS